MSGYLGWCSTPVAAMTTSASSSVPDAVTRCQPPSEYVHADHLLAESDPRQDVMVLGHPLEIGGDLGTG